MGTELSRLRAVNRFKKADVAVTDGLNEIVNFIAQICDTPVALITLVDEDTEWFKASAGVDINRIDRNLSFCNITIQQQDLIIANDMLTDERFCNHELVTADPFVRFYAAATLITKDGQAIGSLCVIDFKPRQLDDHQQNLLRVLAKQAMNLMELNWNLRNMEKRNNQIQKQKAIIEASELKLNAIFNSSRHTHILVNEGLDVIAFNRAAAVFVEYVYSKTLKTGTSVLEYADKEAVAGFAKYFEAAFTDKTIKLEWHMRPGTQYDSWKEMEFVPIKNNNDKIIGVALNAVDITERKMHEEHINIQNAALTRIAIMQSHEIRRPVASLIGIMALMKMEKDGPANSYLDLLEHTVNELDDRIREVVKDSEDTLNNHMHIVA
jgi:PAS domain S-box-containing protein